jgi:hypothetical protein
VDSIFAGSRFQGENRMIMLLDRVEEVPLLTAAIAQRSREQGEPIRVESIADLVPPDQPARLVLLRELHGTLERKVLGWMTADQRRAVDRFRPPADPRPLRAEDLPEMLRRPFTERDGTIGRVVYVSPMINAFEGKRLLAAADVVREVPLANGNTARAAGYQVILGDILRAVITDGPVVTLVSFAGVLVLVVLAFRRTRDRALVLLALVAGVVWMCGAAALLGIKVNMLNFVALPITFGIGVDYPVNLHRRYVTEAGGLARALRTTGGAVALCSATTIIGYGSLLFADTQALSSFGLLAVVGELTTLGAALLWMPCLILAMERRFGPLRESDPPDDASRKILA